MAAVAIETSSVLPIAPHGGQLVWRLLEGEAALEALEQARRLPVLTLTQRLVQDVQLLGVGAYSPLEGFMNRETYESVVTEMTLPSGLPWTLPVVLPVSHEQARDLFSGTARRAPPDELALAGPDGRLYARLAIEEVFSYDREREASRVFGTTDLRHPGVAALYAQGDRYVAGPVTLLRYEPPFPELSLTPAMTRREFARRGWRRVVGFQTRNPVHRAHEYIQKAALEVVDGLLLHPLVGETRDEDLPAEVRLLAYREALQHYYPSERVVLATFPAAMRYAGPREAVFHALVRKNYGCTHFVVGRDHAGVGGFYGPYDAHRIFERFDASALGITPLFFEDAFFCRRCGGMASSKTCPHGPHERVSLSGTRVRAMLRAGELPPPEVVRPEVARVLMEAAMRAGAGAQAP